MGSEISVLSKNKNISRFLIPIPYDLAIEAQIASSPMLFTNSFCIIQSHKNIHELREYTEIRYVTSKNVNSPLDNTSSKK